MATIENCIKHHQREKIYRKGAIEEMHQAAATAAREVCGPESRRGRPRGGSAGGDISAAR